MFERQVLELPPELRHTEAVRERRVEVARFLRDALSFFRRKPVERPHVVQAVGELDDDDAQVLGDRQQELAIALDLPLLRRSAGRQLGDLRQPVDDRGDLLAELRLDVGEREVRVLDDVVQQPARDGDRIELEVGEDLRDFDGVRDVRIAGIANLAPVRRFAIPIGAQRAARGRACRAAEARPRATQASVQRHRRRRRHNSPASAKLVYRPRPMIT